MTQYFSEDPEAIPGAKIIRKGFIRAYTSGTHTGNVQLVGSHPTLLTGIRFATDIPAAECDVGRECLVIFLDPINQTDAIVLSIQGAVPGAPGGGDTTFIAHTDTPAAYAGQAHKGVKVNAGETGLEFVTTWPTLRHTFSEGVTSGKTLFGLAQDIAFATGPTVTASGTVWAGVKASPIISGNPNVVQGLNFIVRCNRQDGGNMAALEGCRAGWNVVDGYFNLTDAAGFVVPTPHHGALGAHTIANSYGFRAQNVGNSNLIAKAVSFRAEDHSAAIISYLAEFGPSTPYFRVVGKAAPGAGLTNLYLNEGGTLRRVQWIDPGAGGANFVGGERVMVLV